MGRLAEAVAEREAAATDVILINAIVVPVLGALIMGRTMGDAFLYSLVVRLERRQLSRRERAYIVAVWLCCAAYISNFVVLPIVHVVLP